MDPDRYAITDLELMLDAAFGVCDVLAEGPPERENPIRPARDTLTGKDSGVVPLGIWGEQIPCSSRVISP